MNLRRVAVALAALAFLFSVGNWSLLRYSGETLSTAGPSKGYRIRPPVPTSVAEFSCAPPSPTQKCRLVPGTDVCASATSICVPEGDPTFSIEASAREYLDFKQTPVAAFVIAKNGQVHGARIIQSSGSEKLDSRILGLIAARKFGPTHCGECQVRTTVGIEYWSDPQ